MLAGLRKRPELRKASCWIVTVSPGDPRAFELARRHNCQVQSSTYYSDYTLMLLAPRFDSWYSSNHTWYPVSQCSLLPTLVLVTSVRRTVYRSYVVGQIPTK